MVAVVCSHPSNVLLLSGYWPVTGQSIAICVRDGPTVLILPEDELEFAAGSMANWVETFLPETLDSMPGVLSAVKPRIAATFGKLKMPAGPIGVDSGASSQAASYLAMFEYGNELSSTLRDLLPQSELKPVDHWLQVLKSVKTARELSRIREACGIAKRAYEEAAPQLRAGLAEDQAAQLFRALLDGADFRQSHTQRRGGFAFCMSGPNSAKASAAYACTRSRALEPADLVMVHCNSYVDGFWTDITRTYTLQKPDERQEKIYDAVHAARAAALAAIKPGARAADVDSATREMIHNCGFGKYLRHGTGHGVGFSPMSALSIPRVHAESSDVLQEGMVLNVEPAVYIQDYGGVRHCDMVAVKGTGCELLTDFQSEVASLSIWSPESRKKRFVGAMDVR